mmetsp:Transcript_34292/g.86740  ORF Transcript_34292/g.86740 Transcript_34292/m.86740 type:complete len:221 (-) Transcript_34292:187-849(-)
MTWQAKGDRHTSHPMHALARAWPDPRARPPLAAFIRPALPLPAWRSHGQPDAAGLEEARDSVDLRARHRNDARRLQQGVPHGARLGRQHGGLVALQLALQVALRAGNDLHELGHAQDGAPHLLDVVLVRNLLAPVVLRALGDPDARAARAQVRQREVHEVHHRVGAALPGVVEAGLVHARPPRAHVEVCLRVHVLLRPDLLAMGIHDLDADEWHVVLAVS